MADDHHLVGVELGPAGRGSPDRRRNTCRRAVRRTRRRPVRGNPGHGPVGVPGDFDRLPGLEVGVDPLRRLDQFPRGVRGFSLRTSGVRLGLAVRASPAGLPVRRSVARTRVGGRFLPCYAFPLYCLLGFRLRIRRRVPLENTHHTKFPEKIIHRLGACVGIFRQTPPNQLGKLGGDVRVLLPLTRGATSCRCLFSSSFALRPCKWGLSRQQLVDRAGEAVQVGPPVERRRRGFARARCSSWFPEASPWGEPVSPSAAAALRQGEVDHLHLAVVAHQEIVRLDVAMDPADPMEVGQRLGGLVDHLGYQRRNPFWPRLKQPLLHVRSRKPLHDEVRLTRVPSRGVDFDDVRMLDLLPDEILPMQKLHLLAVWDYHLQQGLDADDSLLLVVVGLPDHAGMAGMDDVQQPVGTDVAG